MKFLLFVGLILFVTKGLCVRKVIWEGGAPIAFGRMIEVKERLIGRPIWLISKRQIQNWLEGELIGKLEIRRKLPWTVVIVSEPPDLMVVIPKGSKGIVVDQKGFKKVKVPLFATHLPFLMLPNDVPVQKCMVAVKRILETSFHQGINVRAIWLNRFGEAAVYLPEGFWLRLGNPKALDLKLRLGKIIYQNKLLTPDSVADLSALKVIGLRQGEQKPRR